MLINMKIILPVEVKKKGRFHISSCPLLDVYSQGESERKAIENLREALKLFFISCIERKVLGEVLLERGIRPLIEKPSVEDESLPARFRKIEVPLPFTTNFVPSECYA